MEDIMNLFLRGMEESGAIKTLSYLQCERSANLDTLRSFMDRMNNQDERDMEHLGYIMKMYLDNQKNIGIVTRFQKLMRKTLGHE